MIRSLTLTLKRLEWRRQRHFDQTWWNSSKHLFKKRKQLSEWKQSCCDIRPVRGGLTSVVSVQLSYLLNSYTFSVSRWITSDRSHIHVPVFITGSDTDTSLGSTSSTDTSTSAGDCFFLDLVLFPTSYWNKMLLITSVCYRRRSCQRAWMCVSVFHFTAADDVRNMILSAGDWWMKPRRHKVKRGNRTNTSYWVMRCKHVQS